MNIISKRIFNISKNFITFGNKSIDYRYFTSSNLTIKNPSKSILKKEKVVILGCGWASYSFLMKLKTEYYDVKLISPRNHFLFTPLLASTSVGTLEFRSIAEPIRNSKDDFQYIQAECLDIDSENKKLKCFSSLHGKDHPFEVDYDKLIIGVGSKNNTFGIPGVEKYAHFMKELHHARAIRKKIIELFEMASMPDCTDEERQRLLQFVVVGGGSSGVEFTAELSDAANEDFSRWYPNAPINEVRITLLEASGKILNAFDEALVKKAMTNFKRTGVDVRTHSAVKEVHENKVILKDGSEVKYGLLVWATGIGQQNLIQELKFQKDKHNRVQVDKFLNVTGNKDIFAIGDCAGVVDENLPATAQVAQQEGNYLAHQFNEKASKDDHQPFEFHSKGLLAYVGKQSSLLQTKYFDLYGFVAFLSWRSAYLTRLGSIRAKIQVPMDWFRTMIFGRDISNF